MTLRQRPPISHLSSAAAPARGRLLARPAAGTRGHRPRRPAAVASRRRKERTKNDEADVPSQRRAAAASAPRRCRFFLLAWTPSSSCTVGADSGATAASDATTRSACSRGLADRRARSARSRVLRGGYSRTPNQGTGNESLDDLFEIGL